MTPQPVSLPDGFRPYVWAPPLEEQAAARGLSPAQVIRFDANVPPLPGVPQIPLTQSFARLNEYPPGGYRELHAAAAGYVGVEPEQIAVGAGADELIFVVARTFLGAGRRATVADAPTYPVYRIASELALAQVTDASWDALPEADVVWVCSPHNPTGAVRSREEICALASSRPDTLVVVDEAYVEYGGETAVPLIAELPNVVVLRTLSKAFGMAALRVGYAVASPDAAQALRERSEPAPVTAPSAAIAAAALRNPRTDVDETTAERERVRGALLAAGFDSPPSAGNFLFLDVPNADELFERLANEGLIVRRYPSGLRFTIRQPAENDRLLRALGADAPASDRRSALVTRTTTETALRITLGLDGRGRARVDTGVGFLDHLLTLFAFHGKLDLDLLAGGDVDVDEHHTVEDVMAALGDAFEAALAGREGLVRYGTATIPMDEARGFASVDLVKRPHAEIALQFSGDRVGGLALSLLPHALERFAMQARCTVHVEASGADDHHVAEAAFKALGRALGEACARTGSGEVSSTKGEA
jgi:histidinol-phosphate aminotransferase